MVSPIVLLVPIYTVVGTLRLLDSHAGLLATYVAVQLRFTFTFLAGFSDGLPAPLFEAAVLDGATRARTLLVIALPLIGPGLAATAIFNLAAYCFKFSPAPVIYTLSLHDALPI